MKKWTFYKWNSFDIAETDGRLRPKHVVRGRSDRNSCINDGIILRIKNQGQRSVMICMFMFHIPVSEPTRCDSET